MQSDYYKQDISYILESYFARAVHLLPNAQDFNYDAFPRILSYDCEQFYKMT